MSYGQVAVAILIAPKYLLHLNCIITFTYFRTCDTFGSRFTFKISLRQLPDTLPDLLRRRTLSTVSAQVLYNRIPTIQLSIAGRYYSTATAVIGICRNCISIYIKQKWALAQCLHFISEMAQKFAVTAKPPIPPFLPDPGGSRFSYPAFPG